MSKHSANNSAAPIDLKRRQFTSPLPTDPRLDQGFGNQWGSPSLDQGFGNELSNRPIPNTRDPTLSNGFPDQFNDVPQSINPGVDGPWQEVDNFHGGSDPFLDGSNQVMPNPGSSMHDDFDPFARQGSPFPEDLHSFQDPNVDPFARQSSPFPEDQRSFEDPSVDPFGSSLGGSGVPSTGSTGDPYFDRELAKVEKAIQEVYNYPLRQDGTLDDSERENLEKKLERAEKKLDDLEDEGLPYQQIESVQRDIDELKAALVRSKEYPFSNGKGKTDFGSIMKNFFQSGGAESVIDLIDAIAK